MSWTDERIEQLKKLAAEGCSASQISARIGGFDHCVDGGRSAVIGKLHRLKVDWHGSRSRMFAGKPPGSRHRARKISAKASTPSRPIPADQTFKTKPLPPEIADNISMHQRKTIATLTASCCRWPIGDPQKPAFHFCGAKKGVTAYCDRHAKLAFRVPEPRPRPFFVGGQRMTGPTAFRNPEEVTS